MKSLWDALFPPTRHDLEAAEAVKRANIALELSRTNAARAVEDHRRATEELTEAMAESVSAAQRALEAVEKDRE